MKSTQSTEIIKVIDKLVSKSKEFSVNEESIEFSLSINVNSTNEMNAVCCLREYFSWEITWRTSSILLIFLTSTPIPVAILVHSVQIAFNIGAVHISK